MSVKLQPQVKHPYFSKSAIDRRLKKKGGKTSTKGKGAGSMLKPPKGRTYKGLANNSKTSTLFAKLQAARRG